MFSTLADRSIGSVMSRVIRTAGCLGELQLARTDLDADAAMLIRALVNQYAHLGNTFRIECPVGSGRQLNLLEVSQELARRLSRLFIRNKEGRRPAQGNHSRWNDEHWLDHVLFYEYFHGDTGAGMGPAIRLAGPVLSPS